LPAPKVDSLDRLSLAFETNGRGCLGFIVQLPGAYVRAPTETEALTKVRLEMASYYRWLGIKAPLLVRTMITQWHQSQIKVEDADSEILLDADRKPFQKDEFRLLLDLVKYSGETFFKAYENAEHKDWVDESKRRSAFYGAVPSTIGAVMEHVSTTQHFYLARMGVQMENGTDDFLEIRVRCADQLVRLYEMGISSSVVASGEELWTLKKVMRRLIWHDRIHGQAIIRMQVKQKQLKLIDDFSDPFRFLAASLRQSAEAGQG